MTCSRFQFSYFVIYLFLILYFFEFQQKQRNIKPLEMKSLAKTNLQTPETSALKASNSTARIKN